MAQVVWAQGEEKILGWTKILGFARTVVRALVEFWALGRSAS